MNVLSVNTCKSSFLLKVIPAGHNCWGGFTQWFRMKFHSTSKSLPFAGDDFVYKDTYIAQRYLHESLKSQLIKEQSWRIHCVAQINICCGLTFLFECVCFCPSTEQESAAFKIWFLNLGGFWGLEYNNLQNKWGKILLCNREDSPTAQERAAKLGQKSGSFLIGISRNQ